MEKLLGEQMWVTLFTHIGLGQWLRYFTAIVQVTGALFYSIPRTSRVGMALLACTMLGAVGVHLFVLGTGISAALIPGFLFGVIIGAWKWGEADDRGNVISIR